MRSGTRGLALLVCVLAGQAAGQCVPVWSDAFVRRDSWEPTRGVGDAVVFAGQAPGTEQAALYVSGAINLGGVPATAMTKWDGSAWTGLWGSGGPNLNGLTTFDEDGPGPLYPAIYSAGGGFVVRWNGLSWSAVGQSLWAEEYPGAGRLPARCAAISAPGLVPTLYTVCDGTWQGDRSTSSFGELFRLDGGTWTQVFGDPLSTGRITSIVAFDPDGSGPVTPALYLVDTATYSNPFSGVTAVTSSLSRLDGSVATQLLSFHRTYQGGNPPVESFNALAGFDDDGAGPHPPALYVGGRFAIDGLSGLYQLAKLEGGTLVPVVGDADGPITSLQVLDEDGPGPRPPALYALGSFTTIGGVAARSVARFDGTSWSAVGPGFDPIGSVKKLVAIDDDGPGPHATQLWAVGEFTNSGLVPCRGIAHWDGLAWLPPGRVMSNPVHTLAAGNLGAGTRVFAGGEFIDAGEIRAVGVAAWDGSEWSSLAGGTNNHVDALTVFDDGHGPALYAGGKFTWVGGITVGHAAKWNGAAWSALGAGLNGNVRSLAVYNDGTGPALYAGGEFTSSGSTATSHIAKWDGGAWRALGAGTDDEVDALAVYGGELYAGGAFAHAGGLSAPHIARWNGSAWHAAGAGVDGEVRALAAFDGGHGARLFVGGSFTHAAGVGAAHAAVWDGSAWAPAGTGTDGDMLSFGTFDPGTGARLYAGGLFSHAGGVVANHLARWTGSDWAAADAQGLDGPALAMTSASVAGQAPSLYLGGSFMSAGGAPSWMMAALRDCTPACYANCDGSTAPPVLNVGDFLCFQTRFANGDSYANCDGSTLAPVLNVGDFLCFQQRFAGGCP